MLKYPKEAFVDSVIPKKEFYNYYNMKSKDKKLFEDIKQIKWLYSFQKDTLNINPYADDEKEYSEIEVIQVILKKITNNIERIAEIIHRVMPYPLLLIFKYDSRFLISLAHKRKSKKDNDGVVLTDMRYTTWINEDFLEEFDKKLLSKLDIKNLDKTNFYKMYSSMVDAIILTNGSKEIGQDVTVPVDKIREINDEIYYIKLDINKKEAELKKETQFNKKVEINEKIHKLKRKMDNLKKELV